MNPQLRHRLSGPAPSVAPMLLGWRLTHATAEGTVAVVLTEVEAYGGVGDPASHAYRGETQRNTVMFGPAGHLYCYFSYGMHWCANVVCGEDGVAMAVLLRAGRLVTGADLARERRGPTVRDRDLARGPARLTRALGIEGRHNGVDLLGGGPLTLSPSAAQPAYECGPRVGIRLAADQPWRFWITGDETVSSYRRSPRATPVTDDPAGAAAGH